MAAARVVQRVAPRRRAARALHRARSSGRLARCTARVVRRGAPREAAPQSEVAPQRRAAACQAAGCAPWWGGQGQGQGHRTCVAYSCRSQPMLGSGHLTLTRAATLTLTRYPVHDRLAARVGAQARPDRHVRLHRYTAHAV